MTPNELIGRSLLGVAVLLVLTELLGRLLGRFHQPRVLAGVLAAAAIGPSLLGRFPGDPTSFLFPAESRAALAVVGKLGLVLFAFAIGLELERQRVRSQSRAVLAISAGAVTLPLLTGAGLAFALFADHAPAGVGRPTFVLFVATACAITAFPVLVAILVERGVQGTRLGELAIGSAAIQDIFGWLLLATALATLSSEGSDGLVRVVIVGPALVLALVALQRPLRWLVGASGGGSRQLALAVGFACTCAAITELAGLEAVSGAFAAGLAFPRGDGERRATIVSSVTPLTVEVLLPVYFLGAGLQLDLGLAGPGWLFQAALITVVACASKLVGGFVPALLVGLPRRSAAAIGVLVNTRGLMELIVLTIGYSEGVIDSRLYGEMVVMALACTMMTGPLLDRLTRRGAAAPLQGRDEDLLWSRTALARPRTL